MSALEQLQSNLRERAVARAALAADIAVEETRAATSRRTGALVQSITATQPHLVSSDRVGCEITAAAEHARYQDEGTGVYGPTGSRIFPKSAKVLRFDWPAAGGVVFAKSVEGSPGTHFFSEPMPGRWREALIAAGGV